MLQHLTKWQWSSSKLIGALKSAQSLALPQGYELVQGNDDFQALCQYLRIDWQLQYVPKEKVNRFSRGWLKNVIKSGVALQ